MLHALALTVLLASPPPPDLGRLGAAIKPSADELAYERIPWRLELEPAVAEARQKNLPLLVWVMNGDPLGGV